VYSAGSLDDIIRRAGAVAVTRDGVEVTAHFGSPAGELAVCVGAVGLADRNDLGQLVLTGNATSVTKLVERMTGVVLAIGGVAFAGGVWWCAPAPGRVIAVCEPRAHDRLRALLRLHTRHLPGVDVADETTARAAIGVVGRKAIPLLAAIGALGQDGDARTAPPFGASTIAGVEAYVLLQSDHRALALIDLALAGQVWCAIEEAGRPLGLSLVGAEAVQRFELLERAALGVLPHA
jgi:glycine cleavage system aminomethyltransferase T